MTTTALLRALGDCGVAIRVDGDRLRLSPATAVPKPLVAELRRLKPDLLAQLACVTHQDRLAAYERAVAEANRRYRGGPIDWQAVDEAANRILNAETNWELQTGVKQYAVAIAGPPRDGEADVAN